MSDIDHSIDKATGKVRETAGKVTGDKDMEAQGKLQATEASARQKIDDATEGIRDTASDAAATVRAVADRAKEALHRDDADTER